MALQTVLLNIVTPNLDIREFQNCYIVMLLYLVTLKTLHTPSPYVPLTALDVVSTLLYCPYILIHTVFDKDIAGGRIHTHKQV